LPATNILRLFFGESRPVCGEKLPSINKKRYIDPYSFRVAWTFDVAFTTLKLKAVAYRVLTGQFVDKPTLGQSSRGIGQLAGSEI